MTTFFLESFDANDYAAIVRVSQGARHEHRPADGWDGGGCAAFWAPNTGTQGNSGIGLIALPSPQDTVYVRWCVKFGPTFMAVPADTDKFLLFNRSSGGGNTRAMLNLQPYQVGRQHLFLTNNIDREPPSPPVFRLDGMENQWWCYEVKMSLSENVLELRVSDRFGKYTETLVDSIPIPDHQGGWSGLDFLGGFWGVPNTNLIDEDSYMLLDDVRIDDVPIGPPAGFQRGLTFVSEPETVRTDTTETSEIIWPNGYDLLGVEAPLSAEDQLNPNCAVVIQCEVSDDGVNWRHWNHIGWRGGENQSSRPGYPGVTYGWRLHVAPPPGMRARIRVIPGAYDLDPGNGFSPIMVPNPITLRCGLTVAARRSSDVGVTRARV